MGLTENEKNKMLRKMQDYKDGVYGMIRDGWFQNHNMPLKPNKPRLKMDHTSIQALNYAEELVEYEQKIAKYNEEIKNYRAKAANHHELFKFAAMYDYGLDGLKPEVYSKAFSMAWERGHSACLHEVYNCLADIADLLILTIEKR